MMTGYHVHVAGLVVGLLLLAGPVPAQDESPGNDKQWHALAAYWSPLVLQSTRHNFIADVVTSFDFDGDWNAANNHDQTKPFLPSTVYYWVIETENRHYIGYAFYHLYGVDIPEDTEEGTTYAHDLQGIVIAVEKTDDRPMGRFLGLTTWGDGRETLYGERTALDDSDPAAAVWQQNVVFTGDTVEESLDVNFMLDNRGFHPVIYAEAGHHSIYGQKSETGFPEGPALYESRPVVDLRAPLEQRDTMSEAARTRGHRPGSATYSASATGSVPGDDGLIYRYEDFAQPVLGPTTRGRGTVLHHWNLVGYELQSLSAFWERRDGDTGAGEKVFDASGAFASNLGTGPSSHAPWAWGAVFFDPAGYFGGFAGASEVPASVISTSFASTEEFAEQAAAGKTAQ